MKIVCSRCNIERTLTKEKVEKLRKAKELLFDLVLEEKEMRPNNYLDIINSFQFEKCTGGKNHIFVFDEEFSKQVHDIIKIDKTITDNIDKIQTNIDKIMSTISELNDKMSKLNSEKSEIEKQKEDNQIKFENLTYTRDMIMWS